MPLLLFMCNSLFFSFLFLFSFMAAQTVRTEREPLIAKPIMEKARAGLLPCECVPLPTRLLVIPWPTNTDNPVFVFRNVRNITAYNPVGEKKNISYFPVNTDIILGLEGPRMTTPSFTFQLLLPSQSVRWLFWIDVL